MIHLKVLNKQEETKSQTNRKEEIEPRRYINLNISRMSNSIDTVVKNFPKNKSQGPRIYC
jgi:hypothetical protein